MTQGDADALQQISRFCWNSKIWRVAISVQHRFEEGYEPSDMDALRIDFRHLVENPTGRIRHRKTGSLWIDPNVCGVRLERSGDVVAASGDSSEKVLAEFKQLVGKTLVRIEVAPPGGDTNFFIEDGLLLRCFPATGRCNESWRIFPSNGHES
jgi:hypothetical protein